MLIFPHMDAKAQRLVQAAYSNPGSIPRVYASIVSSPDLAKAWFAALQSQSKLLDNVPFIQAILSFTWCPNDVVNEAFIAFVSVLVSANPGAAMHVFTRILDSFADSVNQHSFSLLSRVLAACPSALPALATMVQRKVLFVNSEPSGQLNWLTNILYTDLQIPGLSYVITEAVLRYLIILDSNIDVSVCEEPGANGGGPEDNGAHVKPSHNPFHRAAYLDGQQAAKDIIEDDDVTVASYSIGKRVMGSSQLGEVARSRPRNPLQSDDSCGTPTVADAAPEVCGSNNTYNSLTKPFPKKTLTTIISRTTRQDDCADAGTCTPELLARREKMAKLISLMDKCMDAFFKYVDAKHISASATLVNVGTDDEGNAIQDDGYTHYGKFTLVPIFLNSALKTRQLKFMQFAMFYALSKSQPLAQYYLVSLFEIAFVYQDTQYDVAVEASNYLASFTARAGFLEPGDIMTVCHILSSYVIEFGALLGKSDFRPERTITMASLARSSSSYIGLLKYLSAIRCLFYSLCYTYRFLSAKELQTLLLPRIILCGTRPLCYFPDIFEKFLHVMEVTGAFLDSEVQRCKQMLSENPYFSISDEVLPGYYPFEPYSLEQSAVFIDGLYREFVDPLYQDNIDPDY